MFAARCHLLRRPTLNVPRYTLVVADAFDITSVQNPRVKAAVTLREHRARRETGLFIAEGVREITRALDAGLRPVELFVCPQSIRPREADALTRRAKQVGALVFRMSPQVLEKIAYCENPEGVVAVFEQPVFRIEDAFSPSDAKNTGSHASPRAELWLIAVGTQKPGNLGAMVRTADAAGVTGVIVADGIVDAFNPNAIRASTAAVFVVPVVAATRERVAEFLRMRHVRAFAAVAPPAEGSMAAASGGVVIAYSRADFTGPSAIVIGPEDTGLDPAWLKLTEDTGGARITIPMHGRAADSLNASNAAAILLFEALRQRERP